MRILVLSDSHGNVSNMITAIENLEPDAVFFLGDGARQADALSEKYDIPFYIVKGNCDMGMYEDEQFIELRGKRFFMTHGHNYFVKSGYDTIEERGRKLGADVVLFGHTHIPSSEYKDGIYLFNPGSCARPITGRPSCGYIDIVNNSVFTSIVQL